MARSALTKKRLGLNEFTYSLSFDGIDDSAITAVNMGIDGVEPYTFGGWFKVNRAYSTEGDSNGVMAIGTINAGVQGSGPLLGLNFSISEFTIANSMWGGSLVGDALTGSIPTNNRGVSNWTHLVVKYDGAEITIWLNGQFFGTALSVEIASINGPIAIGGVTLIGLGTLYSKSEYTKLFCYNRALSSSEIEDIYANQIYASNGLLAQYPFNEGSGTVINDSTSNNYDMTITGAPVWNTTGLPAQARVAASTRTVAATRTPIS